jgi:hypothetical protein
VLEIKVTIYGLLTAGGLASLVFGSMILMDSSAPELQLSLRVIIPLVLGSSGDEVGHALTSVGPDARASVATHGVISNCEALRGSSLLHCRGGVWFDAEPVGDPICRLRSSTARARRGASNISPAKTIFSDWPPALMWTDQHDLNDGPSL